VQKRTETRLLASERLKEFEDSPELLERKCSQLAEVIRRAKYLVVYSGAGISTSAQIPDYRGPNGIWTLLKNGQSLDSQNQVVLTTADPTLTHMSIRELYSRGTVKHIVSQNCDGLHLRSGIPKNALSEVHGNMYVEVCLKCCREYVRLFDVTENTRR
jgi:NAD-dependent deacetylase sirtuin 7